MRALAAIWVCGKSRALTRYPTMPMYAYECAACPQVFEVIQKFSDEPVATCPECSGPVERQLGHPALVFKGAGFYTTDYKRAGSTASADSTAPCTPTGCAKPSCPSN